MEVVAVKTGLLAENAYFVVNDQKEVLIFDPGSDANDLLNLIKENGWNPVAIALTHAHYDHIGAIDAIKAVYDIPVYVHEIEKEFLENPNYNLSFRHEPHLVRVSAPDYTWDTMGPVTIGHFSCRIEHVPGHSPGSTVYIFEEDGFAIVGDTLFKGGCGRTDLPFSSSHAELMKGIQAHLMTLPDQTIIYAGHGDATTVEVERLTNPYLNGVTR